MDQETEKLCEQLTGTTAAAFSGFCEDIGGMFDVTANCVSLYSGKGKAEDLKKDFKKLVSVNHVQGKGTLHGTYDLMFDQAGTFIVAGIFVMLPEKRILEFIRSGLAGDSDFIRDAIKEAGNLLVGSWDRVFRENLKGHEHFLQKGTAVGDLWGKPEEQFGFSPDADCFYSVCQIKVEPYPDFKCAAIFPLSVLSPQQETPAAAQTAATAETPAPAEVTAEIAEQETPSPEPKADMPPAGPVRQAISELTQTLNDVKSFQGGHSLDALTAGQIMKSAVIWVDPEDTVEQVMKQMQQHNSGYVLVGRDHQVEGLVSRSDIAAAVSPYLRAVFAHLKRPLDTASLQIRIKWFMSRPVHSIGPGNTLDSVIHYMLKYGVRGLPVIDNQSDVLGFITVFDILQALASGPDMTLTGQASQMPVLL